MLRPKFKICGIKTIDTIDCCIDNNVDFFGLTFYKTSPRNIEIIEAIKLVSYSQHKPIIPVGVFVNKPILELLELIKQTNLNYIQLHGEENFDYILNLKEKINLKVIKNIGISSIKDLDKIKFFPNVDYFLFDYKPTKKELPGGNAKQFDWNLLKNINIKQPWFLSGGINIDNIKEIYKYIIPYGIDISSGVEGHKGIKSLDKINKLFKFFDAN